MNNTQELFIFIGLLFCSYLNIHSKKPILGTGGAAASLESDTVEATSIHTVS